MTMKEKQKVKDNHLKVRVSEKERNDIISNANYLNKNVSDYIRYCCLSTNDYAKNTVPNFIKTSNLLNDIIHYLEPRIDSQTLEDTKKLIATYYKGGNHHGYKK